MAQEIGKVLVVGAGVAGIRAALDLAETGYSVLLTESSPAIGGILSKLDFQFPNDHCGMCRMLPFIGREHASQFCMRKSLFHDNISILPNTSIVDVSGEPGDFNITLEHEAEFVDTVKCIGECLCAEICPVEVGDQFNESLTRRKAIYRPVPHNLPNLWTIDQDACTRCGECVPVCPVGAINLDAKPTREEINVGAVILAAGAGLYQIGSDPDFYAYSSSLDVLTSLEFERIVSTTGTFKGSLVNPKTGKEIKKIAWLSCVGSRNRKAGRDYCSSVCCMFSLKEAILAKQRGGDDTDVTIFYMDMRAYGKDYHKYRMDAEDMGVRLVRCRAHSVDKKEDGGVSIRYFGADGEHHVEDFDLVVLATGQNPPPEAEKLKELFGYRLNDAGFIETTNDYSVTTTSAGVFACGSMTGLKDISETVLQGRAAALQASTVLRTKGFTGESANTFQPKRDVSRELPKVFVVLCRWPAKEGASGVDFEALADELRAHDAVEEVHIASEVCRGGADDVRELLEASKANRVLFGACLPYMYKKQLKDLAGVSGFDLALVEVYDLRGLARSIVHSGQESQLKERLLTSLRGKVNELCVKDPVKVTMVDVEPRALVVGGGVAGMQAALSLANHGVDVELVERSGQLGGFARNLHYTLEGFDPEQLADRMSDEVMNNPAITVHKGAEVVDTRGRVGGFRTRVRLDGEDTPREIHHATTIIATGGHEAPTSEYLYGENESVLTQHDLEEKLTQEAIDAKSLKTVVMIQCVGSREKGKREYCSRICCASALKNALALLDRNPELRIIVLYRDIMAYGLKERRYTEARKRGVLFCTYSLPDSDGEGGTRPKLTAEEGKLSLQYFDEVLREDIAVKPDLVVLSTGVVPNENKDLARSFGVDMAPNGFFDELDYKWQPVETLKEGITICGTAHSPRSIPEALVMAEAAAQSAMTVLSQKQLTSARLVTSVRQALCTSCEACIELCPYNARSIDLLSGHVVVDELACQGCGVCVAGCPSGAATFSSLLERQVMQTLDAHLMEPLGFGSVS